MKISDPTCGSGGMLVISRKYVKDHGGNIENWYLMVRSQTMETWVCVK